MRTYIKEVRGWNESDKRKMFNERLVLPDIEIIEKDGNVVGMVDVVEDDSCIHINNIQIFLEYQGQGIGTYVTRNIIHSASNKNLPVRLQVLKVNKRAKELYIKLGFQVVGELEHHYKMELENITKP